MKLQPAEHSLYAPQLNQPPRRSTDIDQMNRQPGSSNSEKIAGAARFALH